MPTITTKDGVEILQGLPARYAYYSGGDDQC